jgi:hypothetical protein
LRPMRYPSHPLPAGICGLCYLKPDDIEAKLEK